MMAKPIRALELHYPMIQFFIKLDIFFSVQNILYVFLTKKKIQILQKVLWHLTNCKNLVKQDPIAPPMTTKKRTRRIYFYLARVTPTVTKTDILKGPR